MGVRLKVYRSFAPYCLFTCHCIFLTLQLQEDLEGSLHRLRSTREKRSMLKEPGTLRQSDLRSRRSMSMSRADRARSPISRYYESDVADYSAGRLYELLYQRLADTARTAFNTRSENK